jgi:hypothetical protein
MPPGSDGHCWSAAVRLVCPAQPRIAANDWTQTSCQLTALPFWCGFKSCWDPELQCIQWNTDGTRLPSRGSGRGDDRDDASLGGVGRTIVEQAFDEAINRKPFAADHTPVVRWLSLW